VPIGVYVFYYGRWLDFTGVAWLSWERLKLQPKPLVWIEASEFPGMISNIFKFDQKVNEVFVFVRHDYPGGYALLDPTIVHLLDVQVLAESVLRHDELEDLVIKHFPSQLAVGIVTGGKSVVPIRVYIFYG